MGCGPSAPAENYSPPSTGATENGPQLCLTRKGSPDALVFDQAHNLSGPSGARLTLRSVTVEACTADVGGGGVTVFAGHTLEHTLAGPTAENGGREAA